MWFIPLFLLVPLSSVLVWLHRLKDRRAAPGTVNEIGDTTCKLAHTDRGHGKHWMSVGLDRETGFRFRVLREHALHRALKRIGLAREWQGPDAAFNRACYVVSDDPEVERLLGDPQVTGDLQALLTEWPASADYIPERLEIRPHYVALICRKRRFKLRPQPHGLPAAAIPRLERIAAAMHAHEPATDTSDRDPDRRRMFALVAPAMPLLLVGAARLMVDMYWASGPQLVTMAGLWKDLLLAVPALAGAWLLGACVVLKGSSRLPPALVEIGLVGTLGLALGGGVLAYLANVELDFGPRDIVRTAVVERRADRGGRRAPDRYFLQVRSYRLDDEPVEVRVPRGLFRRAGTAQDLVLTVGRGALGYRWIERVRLADTGTAPPAPASRDGAGQWLTRAAAVGRHGAPGVRNRSQQRLEPEAIVGCTIVGRRRRPSRHGRRRATGTGHGQRPRLLRTR